MAEKSVFERIKKQNGEHFAKAIRAYDSGIFDIPDIVDIVKYAGREAEPIMQYLISLKEIEIKKFDAPKDPIVLLSEAGYDAYYADTLEKQNAIKKYFAAGEELCTFKDPTRFQKYYIVNAVRRDADKIKREDFKGKEQREDEYGTSVLSIQILKSGGFISIKNRYNHTVENPDNTFGSNPDNIIMGLADALGKHFHVEFVACEAILPPHFVLLNTQIVKFNREYDNILFGDNFYLKDGQIRRMGHTEILMDNFVFDVKRRKIKQINVIRGSKGFDSFPKVFKNEIKRKKIQITKEDRGCYCIWADKVKLATVQNGSITTLYLPKSTEIGDYFLFNNQDLRWFESPNVRKIGKSFLGGNFGISMLSLPKLERVGENFLSVNNRCTYLDAPALTDAGDFFLFYNRQYRTNAPAMVKRLPQERVIKTNAPKVVSSQRNIPQRGINLRLESIRQHQ